MKEPNKMTQDEIKDELLLILVKTVNRHKRPNLSYGIRLRRVSRLDWVCRADDLLEELVRPKSPLCFADWAHTNGWSECRDGSGWRHITFMRHHNPETKSMIEHLHSMYLKNFKTP